MSTGSDHTDRDGGRRALFEAMLRRRGLKAPSRIPRRQADGPTPVSPAQRGLWLFHQTQPDNPCHNTPAAFWVMGALDLRALERAIVGLIARHEVFRSAFEERGGHPMQTVAAEVAWSLDVVDVCQVPGSMVASMATELARKHGRRPFDLSRAPLLRIAVLRFASDTSVVLVNVHHIVFDGWSVPIFLNEITELYAAEIQGRPAQMVPLPIQYADFAAWQEDRVGRGEFAESLQRAVETLRGATSTILPAEQARTNAMAHRGHTVSMSLTPQVARALESLAKSSGATLFSVLLAPLAVVLGRYAQSRDLVVGTPTANRSHSDIETLIGLFANVVPLRVDLGGDPAWSRLIARAHEAITEALTAQEVPFDLLVREAQVSRDPTRHPLFDVVVALHEFPLELLRFSGAQVTSLGVEYGCSRFDLELHAIPRRTGELEILLRYDTDLYGTAWAERMLSHYDRLVHAMIAEPGAIASAHDMLTTAERSDLVDGRNATDHPIDMRRGLAQRIESQASATPDRIAVTFGERQMTYRTLNARANRLAHTLRLEYGVGPESLVGICARRSLDMIVAVVAVLKAGGAYLPLDPGYPRERLQHITDDAAPVLVLSSPELAGRVPDGVRMLWIEEGIDRSDRVGNLAPAAGPDNLVYVTYTSGSTGRPKGIAMPQRPLINLLATHELRWGVIPGGRTLQFASLNFDVSFQDIVGSLVAGHTIVVISDEERCDLRCVADAIIEHDIAQVYIATVALEEVARRLVQAAPCAYPEQFIVAGEQLQKTPSVAMLFSKGRARALYNEYGPSEAHAVTVYELDGEPDDWVQPVPIGTPVTNTRIYVIGADGDVVPAGVTGQLHVAGTCLARGYLNRPAMTAERFVPDPFKARPGERMYRTGDLGFYRPSGDLQFVGRIDHQVKIRGHAVDPADAEAAVLSHPAVARAVVLPVGASSEDRRLVAYWIRDEEVGAESQPLRSWLMERFASSLVPSVFIELEAFPLTKNGKIDRNALMALPAVTSSAGFEPPRTILERAVAVIWAELLGRDEVGRDDNFFELGGHSLLATRVVSHVEETLGVSVPLRAVFECATVRAFAQHLVDAAHDRESLEEAACLLLEVVEAPEDEEGIAGDAVTGDSEGDICS